MSKLIRWALKDLVECINKMQNNKFDCIIFIDGSRGLGKSTLAFKICKNLDCGFKPERDIVFKREEVLRALAEKKAGVIFGDEMINVAYNRDFYLQDQKDLLKALNMYRDRCNCFIGCVPNFANLDNQIRQLCKIRITIIRRGVALIHMKRKTINSPDVWDIKENIKNEQRYINRTKPKYGKITTVKGILKFGDLSPDDRERYEKIKEEKRNQVFAMNIIVERDDLLKNIYDDLINFKITREKFDDVMRLAGKSADKIRENLNRRLKDEGRTERVKDFFIEADKLENERIGKSKSKSKNNIPIIRLPHSSSSSSSNVNDSEQKKEGVVAIATTDSAKQENEWDGKNFYSA